MGRTVLKTEKMLSRSQIAEKLEDIRSGIENGSLEISSGDDSVTLQPSERSEFELKVEEEADGDISLEIEIEWNPESKENSDDLEIK